MAFAATGVAQAAYRYRGLDHVNTRTAHSAVGGSVLWYQDCRFPFPCTFRGQFYWGTYAASLGAYRGCIYAKVVWHRLTGAIAWPPSASPNTTSDGYYRSCRRRGEDRPRAIRLTGVNMASRGLFAVTVTTCHARSSSAPKVCSSIKRWA